MRKHVFFGAAIACLALTSTVDARPHHRRNAPCATGQMYRPSLGTCQSRALFRKSMRKVAGYDVRSRKALRPLTRRDRHPKLRGIREVAAETFEPRPSRLLPTRPHPRNDYVQGETEVQAAEAAMMAEESGRRTAQAPARSSGSQQAEFSAIPWTVSGPFSLNPLPRYAARQDLDWRR